MTSMILTERWTNSKPSQRQWDGEFKLSRLSDAGSEASKYKMPTQIKQRKQPKQFIFSAIKTEYIHYKTEHPSSAPENRAKQHTLVPEKKQSTQLQLHLQNRV